MLLAYKSWGRLDLENLDIRERFRAIRGNRTLEEMSQLIKTKKQGRQAWKKLETGETKSLSFEQLLKLFQEGNIDPRELFKDPLETIPADDNPVHSCFRRHPELRSAVEQLCSLEDDDYREGLGILKGYISSRRRPGGKRVAG